MTFSHEDHPPADSSAEAIDAPTDPSTTDTDGAQPTETPDVVNGGQMSAEELAETQEYGRRSLLCDVVEMGIDVAFLLTVSLTLARPLDNWLINLGWETPWKRLLAFHILFTLMHYAITLPLVFYTGHTLEHRFGLSKQSLARWVQKYLLRISLTIAFTALLIEGLYWTIWLCGAWWWIVAALATFGVSILLCRFGHLLKGIDRFLLEVLIEILELLRNRFGQQGLVVGLLGQVV